VSVVVVVFNAHVLYVLIMYLILSSRAPSGHMAAHICRSNFGVGHNFSMPLVTIFVLVVIPGL